MEGKEILQAIADTAALYGWRGDIYLLPKYVRLHNRKGALVAIAQLVGKRVTISDLTGKKLASGSHDTIVSKVLEGYYYCTKL